MDYRIDEIDRRILYYLGANARDVSAPSIAEEVDVSPGTIRNRIRQMEEHGIIRGYHADVDFERVEGRITNLFMCSAPVPSRERMATDALDVPGVVSVTELMSGRENVHVVAVGTDTNDITRIARELADLGLEIEDEALIQRQYHRPYHQFGPDESHPRTAMTDFRRLAGNAEVVDVTVTEGSPVDGMSLGEIGREGLIGDDVLVVAIERGDEMITPKGDTRIHAGDVVTLFSREGVPGDFSEVFTDGIDV